MKMNKSIPALPVLEIEKAVQFYQIKMGFSVLYKNNEFAKLFRDDVELHLWASADESWKSRDTSLPDFPISSGAESFLAGTASCRVEVQGIDELFEEYKSQGVIYSSETVVEEQPWGKREFPALDLYRNLLTFYEII